MGDVITTMPTGSWVPDRTSGASFSISGGNVEIDFNNGGLIEEGGYRYTCENTGGCAVRNREVQTGTIVETSTATTPTPTPTPPSTPTPTPTPPPTPTPTPTPTPLAPADEAAFNTLVVGKRAVTNDPTSYVDFVSPGRFRETEGSDIWTGSYTYRNTGSDTGTVTFNYDDGDRCTTSFTFDSTTSGTSTYTCNDGTSGSSNWRLTPTPTPTPTPPTADIYQPLAGLRVSPGRVQFLFFSAGQCINLSNSSVNGVVYTTHTSKWQRRDSSTNPWTDISGTERDGLCSYSPSDPGEYRLVGEVTIDGTRGKYSSENTITR